jgi:hypothetical protein
MSFTWNGKAVFDAGGDLFSEEGLLDRRHEQEG